MAALNRLIVFILDEKKYALPYTSVERVIRSVEITQLPHAPDTIMGVINVHGKIVPIINIRKITGFPEKELMLSDKIIVMKMTKQTIGFLIDEIDGLIEPDAKDVVMMDKILPDTDIYQGAVKIGDEIVPVFEAGKILSPVEQKTLESLAVNR